MRGPFWGRSPEGLLIPVEAGTVPVIAVGGDVERAVAEVAGERLVIRARELRGDRTLSEIAARMGMRQDELGKIERGETHSIRFETLLKLCSVYEVGLSELFAVESVAQRRVSPLARVLAGVEAGKIQTQHPPKGRQKLQAEDLTMDLAEAVELSDFEEPLQPRRRTRVPVAATK